jgi:hypothetical protein
MEYLTWRQLRDRLNETTTDLLLDEPALFTLLDTYGNETAYPVQLLQDTWHPADTPSTLHYNEADAEYSRFVPDEYNRDGETPLRVLPHGALLLHYSDMDEDGDEQLAYLATPNPHTPPTAPATPGPAPLFE